MATKPTQSMLENMLKPVSDAITAVMEMQLSNRFDPMYTHLTAVADGIRMLAWINIQLRPFMCVEESLESAQFFGNKILKDQTDKYGIVTAELRI